MNEETSQVEIQAELPAADVIAVLKQDEHAYALMAEMANHAGAVSLARLSKRLQMRQSTLLRCIAYLGEQQLGQHQGAGWVSLQQDGERSLLVLTEEGRRICDTLCNTTCDAIK
ncbi:hypothetical protein ACO0K9_05100 [Undibacterium sp. Ji50W]|uniref:hypothetical protein n=1 Tax=Undibacterium sp. Ji50W TaxID=3413041 RepID=UPI003BF231CE